MVQECKYNPEKDIQEVDQFGFVDIAKANATSSIDVQLQLQEERYNGIEDPRSIGTRPSDIFEAAQANKVIAGYVPEEESKE